MTIQEIEKEIHLLKLRNNKVETDKAWEVSLVRKLSISLLTYSVIVIFFNIAELPNPFINALVPTLGYLLSTLSLSFIKKVWEKFSNEQ